MTFHPFSEDNEKYLDELRATALEASRVRYGVLRWTHTPMDLAVLQQIVDDQVFAAHQEWELQSLGAVFGDVLVRQSKLEWAIVSDEYGVDAVVRYPGSQIMVSVLTMMLKRVEDGEEIHFRSLFDGTLGNISRLIDSEEYRHDGDT